MSETSIPHPAERLRSVLAETGLSVVDAASRLRVSRQQLTRLLGRKSAVSPEMALRIESVFGLSAKEILDQQLVFDLDRARAGSRRELTKLAPYRGPLARLNKDYVVKRLRRHEDELRRAGVASLYLFGSVARDEAGPSSDIDLYFEADPKAAIGLIALQRLEKRMTTLLGPKVDLVPGEGFRRGVRESVERDAVRVF